MPRRPRSRRSCSTRATWVGARGRGERSAAAGALDGLLLNAGIVHPPKQRETTVDGHEVVFATNVLGHFALAGELLTDARRGIRPHGVGRQHVDLDVRRTTRSTRSSSRATSAWRAYVQSKVATAALGFEADRRLRAAGVPVASVVAHPGYSTSGRTPGIVGVNEPVAGSTRFADNLQAAITQSKEHGAWPLVRALVDPDIEGGEFWGPRTRRPRRAAPAARRRKITRDPEIAARLWGACEDATGVRWPFAKAARARRVLRPCRRSPTVAQALSQTASAAAAGSDTSAPAMRRVAASVTVTSAPTATPAASTARSSSGSRSLTRSTRPVWPGAAAASSTKGSRCDVARGIRNRIAVRVEPRAAEPLVDALEQPVADRVLEHLGLVVHLVPGVAELAHQPGLDEAVAADDRCRAVLAGSRLSAIGPYGRWVTSPCAASFCTISVTLDGARPSSAASCDGVMRSFCHSVWW